MLTPLASTNWTSLVDFRKTCRLTKTLSPLPMGCHGLFTPTVGCWRDVTLNHCQGLVPTDKTESRQQAINFLLAKNFSATSATSGLRMLVCALDHHHDQGLRSVRCYGCRLGASRRNAHAKAEAALGPGLRQTSHAIVRPLCSPFLSFSLPPSWTKWWPTTSSSQCRNPPAGAIRSSS